MYLKQFSMLIFALVAMQLCAGQNNTGTEGQSGDSDVTVGDADEASALQKGMDPIFDMYHNFLNTVMSKSFYSADTPFNVQDLIDVINKKEYDKLQNNWQDLVNTFGGYAACIIMGLLFVVFMPIVGVIYCCCHCCCNKCGGTQDIKDPQHASCKRSIYTTILLICATFMLVGCMVTFLGSELLHQSLRNEDNIGFAGKLDKSLGHIQTFANQTINDISHIATEEIINKGLTKILLEIKDAAVRTVKLIKDTINATALLDEAADLGEVATMALADLQEVQELLDNLGTLQNDVVMTLDAVKKKVGTACDGLADSCGSSLNSIQDLKFNPNFTTLDKLESETSKIADAMNISTYVTQATFEFDKVTARVTEQVQAEINKSDTMVQGLEQTIKTEIDKLNGKADSFVDSIKKGQNFVTDEQETFNQIADYIWYSCIGLGCLVLLVVFFYYMGVLFGLCGERPGPRAAGCNRGTGANLLCTGICCSFLFAWLIMLVVILLFTLGGLSYSMACKYITGGVENVAEFESVLSDGFNWNISGTFGVKNLTIAGMFRDCKNNTGVYSALHLQYVFDIDKEFNLSDVKDEVKKMSTSQTFNIPDIKLMSDELNDQLDKFKAAAISDINFTEYTTELEKPLFKDTVLDTAISDLTTATENLQNAGKYNSSAAITNATTMLTNLRDITLVIIDAEKRNLSRAITNLQKNAAQSVPDKIESLITSIKASETNFNSKKDTITSEELSKTIEDILTIIEDTVNSAKDYIKDDFGRCRPLYDAAQSVVDAVCIATLDPLNSIWFGLGWSLFFYIPCFIFAALLSNLYKRTEKYKKKDCGFDDQIRSQHTGDYDNSYLGGRQEDNVPLTRMGKDQRHNSNGAHNRGYQGREYEHKPRYHRDERPSPDHNSRDRGVSHGAGGAVYAKPHADPYDQQSPPRHDDAVASSYGGYPSSRHY